MDRSFLIRNGLIIGIILLFAAASILPVIAQTTRKQSSSRGNWLYVGGSGPGNYTKIQNAIDNTTDGDNIYVYDDSSPYEESLWINTSISLIGENRPTTIIKGQLDQNIITIQRDNVVVQGFTLQGISPSQSHSGVFTLADSVVITDNTIQNTSMGIHAESNGSSFTHNEFLSLYRGMWLLESHENQITDNQFGFNEAEDLTIGGTNCLVGHNTFTGRFGIKIWKCSHTTIQNNMLSTTCLLDLYESTNNTINGNSFENGGFTITRSSHNLVFNNTRSGVPIVYLDGQKDITIDSAAQVILVLCDNIQVHGITFADIPCGIYLAQTTNSYFLENTFLNCEKGMLICQSSQRNSIIDCLFTDCAYSIILDDNCKKNNITNNTILASEQAALLIGGSFNMIQGNTISEIPIGIGLTSSTPYEFPTFPRYRLGNIISSNNIQNARYGIIVDACFTTVQNNIVRNCTVGIGITDLAPFSIDTLKGNILKGNTIEKNTLGLEMNLTDFTIITKNNFISNDHQVSYQGIGLIGQLIGTRWSRNYWGEPGRAPKVIPGNLYIATYQYDKPSYTRIQWIEIDWFPAQQPYPAS